MSQQSQFPQERPPVDEDRRRAGVAEHADAASAGYPAPRAGGWTSPDAEAGSWGSSSGVSADQPISQHGSQSGQPAYPFGQPAAHPQGGPPGQPPAGPATGAAYGAWTGQPPARQRASWPLSAAALIVGLISLVLSHSGVISVLSLLGGPAAIVLGTWSLVKGRWRPGTRPWAAVWGIVAGAVAIVTAIVTIIAFSAGFVGALRADDGSTNAPSASSTPSPGSGAVPSPGSSPAPSASAGAPSSSDLALGQAAKIGDWSVAVVGVDLNANAAVAQASSSAPAPRGKYIAVQVQARYDGTSRGNPQDAADLEFQTPDGRTFYLAPVVGPDSVFELSPVRPGTTVSYTTIFDVPADTTSGEVIGKSQTEFSANAPVYYWDVTASSPAASATQGT